MRNWRKRIVVSVALIVISIFGIRILDDIIRVDYCPQLCDQVRAGQRSWWEALALGCWCGSEPNAQPQTNKRMQKAGNTCQPPPVQKVSVIKTSR